MGRRRGALPWRGVCLSTLDERPSYARSLVPTPSKTVDQTLSPEGMGKAGAFTV